MTRSVIGDAPKRREDRRFITGAGRYLDDLRFDRLAHAVVLRSPHARARIGGIDAAAARALPGVLAVLTAAEAAADGLGPLMPAVAANTQTGEPFDFTPQPLLADGEVRYVGEPVALIVAETRAQALDAAEAVAVDYAPLPAVVDPADPAARRCLDWRAGDAASVDAA
ncbi:MAG TPA: xanthine dehydrogenase family protein molybdopterin-binding subunit, partial [Stellaceae bacterium]|nr:xanthine dehydrogenase family protein molybdopterin-binding subunit [Stellaceae bacterium]